MAAHAYPRLLALVTSGVLDPGLLVTSTISLGEAPAALASMDRSPVAGVRLIAPSLIAPSLIAPLIAP
jgi:threonine dehydrogenase-like Zn-dependent dehydrogenase